MRSKLSIVLSALLILGLLVTACAAPAATPAPVSEQPAAPAVSAEQPAQPEQPAAPAAQKILDTVKARGKVVCGIHTSLPGFGYLDADGKNQVLTSTCAGPWPPRFSTTPTPPSLCRSRPPSVGRPCRRARSI